MSLSFSFLHLGLCIGLGCDMVTAVASGLRACVPVVLLHFRCIKVNGNCLKNAPAARTNYSAFSNFCA